MPHMCFCQKCEKFRDRKINQPNISQASLDALRKANAPRVTSRRAKIKAGLGKNGLVKNKNGVEDGIEESCATQG